MKFMLFYRLHRITSMKASVCISAQGMSTIFAASLTPNDSASRQFRSSLSNGVSLPSPTSRYSTVTMRLDVGAVLLALYRGSVRETAPARANASFFSQTTYTVRLRYFYMFTLSETMLITL